MDNQNRESFNEVKARLDQIVEAVSEEDISLDDALSLYEEAVKLGMQATNLLEEDIEQSQVDEAISALEATEIIFEDQSNAGENTEVAALDSVEQADQVDLEVEIHE